MSIKKVSEFPKLYNGDCLEVEYFDIAKERIKNE